MRTADDFHDYTLLDCSGGEKLERWGDVVLVRPDPQIIWNSPRAHPLWERADGRYIRSREGGGAWEFRRALPERWPIRYRDLCFGVRPTGFKHLGLFPEQAPNWAFLIDAVGAAPKPFRMLNLFGYTGAATLAAAAAGAEVTHVDAARGMVDWARDNAALSGLSDRPVRWIVDDAAKYLQREARRGSRYHGVVLDPPSYGRGPGGEVWKLEDQIYPLLRQVRAVLADRPLFVVLSTYTAGLSAGTMQYLLSDAMAGLGGRCAAEELGIPVDGTDRFLPCGSTAIWQASY